MPFYHPTNYTVRYFIPKLDFRSSVLGDRFSVIDNFYSVRIDHSFMIEII